MKRPRPRRTPHRARAWLSEVLNPILNLLEVETWTPVDARRRILPDFQDYCGSLARDAHIARDLFKAHPKILRLLEEHDIDLKADHRRLISRLEKIQGEIADFHGIPPVPVQKPGPCPTCGRAW